MINITSHIFLELLVMVNMPQKKIKEHLDINELENIIKNTKTNCQQYKKFAVIRAVAKGRMVSEICDDLCISEPTGHRWVDLYNEYGPKGLDTHYENSGRPCKLSDDQLDEFNRIAENEDYLTVQRAHEIIKNRYGVDYSFKNVKNILKKLDYYKSKPYQKYSDKPKDAEEMLKKLKISEF